MNLRDLDYLVALAEHEHFGRAAAACAVSQPTLSAQLKRLERELGVELVERTPRRAVLTEAGRQVVERARIIAAEVDTIRDIARRSRDPRSGTLRLGVFPTLGPYLLPHVMSGMSRSFPELEVLLVEEKTAVLLERLADGRLDAAILAAPVADPKLHEELLFREDFLLAVPEGHRLADARVAVSTSVLAGEQLLLLEDGHCLRDQALSVCTLAGARERDGFRATSLETLRQMVASGVGMTLLPRLAAQGTPSGAGVSVVHFRDPAPHRDIAMYWRRSSAYRELLPEVAAEIRSLTERVLAA